MTRAPLGADDLVLSAGTIPRASLRERVAAARAGGFAAISLRVRDLVRAREEEGLSAADVRALLADEGVRVAEIEVLSGWRPGAPAGRRSPSADQVFAAAEAVGARSVSVVEGPGAPPPLDAAVEAFSALCDRGAAAGLLLHFEFWPGSALDLETAARVVAAARKPNGGLLVDSWHLARTPDGDALLARVPGASVLALQISDSPAVTAPEDDYMQATLTRRLVPGEGALDLVGLLRRLRGAGCTAPVSAEI